MSTAQILILARGTSDILANVFVDAVAAAARAQGLTTSRWTYSADPVTIVSGAVSGGPWNGFVGSYEGELTNGRQVFSSFRQNLVGFAGTAEQIQAKYDAVRDAVRNALVAAGAQGVRIAFRAVRTSISWDRGVPATIPLAEEGGAGGGGVGLLAVLGIAGIVGVVAARRDKALRGVHRVRQTSEPGLRGHRKPKRRKAQTDCGCEG